MNRIALFGFALTCSASVLACATPDEDVAPVRDSGAADSSGDSTTDSSTDGSTDTGKTDTGAETPEKCTPPLTDKRACGKCGTQTRSCQATGTWGSWGTCSDEDPAAECSIGEKRTVDCGNCGKQTDTCDNTTCMWNTGTCSGEGECAPGEIKTSTASCTVPGEVRTLTCSDKCKYPDVLSVPCAAPKGWITMATPPSGFEARFRHSGVWTGKEAIFWGGYGSYSSTTSTYGRKNGAAYNVLADTWRLLDSTTMPSGLSAGQGRHDHGAVWTGTQMIVWGGCETTSSYLYYGCYSSYSGTPKADGGLYDPATDKWTAMAAAPIGARSIVRAVWSTTTNEMLVWGGFSQTCNSTTYACSDGAAYSPSTNTWRVLPAAPIGARWGHSAVWTGTEMIVWGGATGTPSSSSPGSVTLKDGARFDPKTNVWTKFPDPTVDIDSRNDFVAEWSGKEMLVYGGWGIGGTSYGKNTGARYTPGGSWTSFKVPGESDFSAGGSKRYGSASWFGGGKLYIFGGSGTSTTAIGGAATYDPATDTWASLDTTDAPTSRSRPGLVWTGKEAVIWGGAAYQYGSTYYADGKVYRP